MTATGALVLTGAAEAAGAGAGAPPAPTSGGVAAQDVPVIDWQPCGEGLEAFLCATVEVPTDHDEPDGATTSIALTKLPAAGAPEQRIGTLFTNPGGPGGSGVDFVQQSAPLAYQPEVLAAYSMSGEMDYLLHVVAADFEAYADFALKALLRMPGVKETRSSFVLQALKPPGGAPL